MADRKELEFRLADAGGSGPGEPGAGDPGLAARAEAVLRRLDPDCTVRHDPATGILHAFARCEALDAFEALQAAGLEPAAPTG